MALRSKKEQKAKKKVDLGTLEDHDFLMELRPREGYVFHSDYYTVDGTYVTILDFFHQMGAEDNYGPFWGVNKIPSGMTDDISVVLLDQIQIMSDKWVNEYIEKSEAVSNITAQEQEKQGTYSSRLQSRKRQQDYAEITAELTSGATYLNVHQRLMVKAKSLESLDEALLHIRNRFGEYLGAVTVEPYQGEQRRELSSFMQPCRQKLGKGWHFTSTEYAGSHYLVTHGLEDARGEYVGTMVGDVNNSAVLFDSNDFGHHIVVADESFISKGDRVYTSDVWGAKIAQNALLNNHRVVHILMDGADLDALNPDLSDISSVINMGEGELNMFEMFGANEDALSVFPAQMQKLILMAEQAYETTDRDRSTIRSELEKIATVFYIDQNMWRENARENFDALRVVGIPHEQVPRLQDFVAYLQTAHRTALAKVPPNQHEIDALNTLSNVFLNLLTSNGSIFNNPTSHSIDGASHGQRVIYDFGGLMRHGKGVAMAQLVNVIGFAVSTLGVGDVVFLHGCELIENRVKSYLQDQFQMLYRNGGRVCYLYSDIDTMLDDDAFCSYTKADYSVFGMMSVPVLKKYQTQMGQEIPKDLVLQICKKDAERTYIRRGYDNVVFSHDLRLGNGKRVLQHT